MILAYIFIVIFLFLEIKNKKYKNPYKLYMVFGKKGSGKSSYLAKLALKYSRKKYIIYTNMIDLNIPSVRYIDPKEIGKFVPEPHSVLLLDEVGMLYDNRHYKDFSNETRDFFKLQRHYKCIVYLASQSFDVDKKLRDLTDEMYLVNNIFGYFSLIRPITKKITLTEASSMGESKIADNLKFKWIFSWKITYLPRYSKYFQSFLLPEHNFISYTENKTPARDKVRARVILKNFLQAKSRQSASEASKKNLGE